MNSFARIASLVSVLALGLVAAPLVTACSSDGSSSGGTSGDGTSSSSSQSCTKEFKCENGACKCSAGPNDGNSCCNPDDDSCKSSSSNCDTYCKVCK